MLAFLVIFITENQRVISHNKLAVAFDVLGIFGKIKPRFSVSRNRSRKSRCWIMLVGFTLGCEADTERVDNRSVVCESVQTKLVPRVICAV